MKNLMAALRTFDRKDLDSINTQILLREQYDEVFQIAKHGDPMRPLSLVAKHPKEDLSNRDSTARMMRRFGALKIRDLFGISWPEFIRQSRAEVEQMFEVAEHLVLAENSRHDALLNAQKNAQRENERDIQNLHNPPT
ncbi:MAG: hypothetical protein E7J78_23305 [Pantoea sp.]|nr:hypothetical protein [Pantoea sp.]